MLSLSFLGQLRFICFWIIYFIIYKRCLHKKKIKIIVHRQVSLCYKLNLIFSSRNDTLYTTKISFISGENTFPFLGKIIPELEFQIVKPFSPGTKLNLVNIYVL